MEGNQWNINRVELFALSLPNENGEFRGVMRFCYQDAGQKVATKCVRVCSNATTLDVIDSLIEKFRADIKMLSVPQYGLYEIHENGEERKLDDDERPLLVQLNWHKDDREGRFLLKRIDEKSTGESGTLTRKLSKSGKKDKKKKEKNEESKESSLAGKLYDELPETCFTRSISNPEAVMKRRRKQKLEKKLQLLQQNGPDAGGTLRIFGECLNPDVPYKTLLLSAKDTARYVVQQILEKYREIGNFQEAEPASSYCLVLVIEPPQDRLIQYILDDNDCPLAIKQKHNPARGQLTFYIRKRSADFQPQITPGSPQVPPQFPSQIPLQLQSQQSTGFKKNETIFGIPHDWRKSVVDTSDEYYKEVIDVILDAVTKNNGTKANLVCHSYGCINMAATIIKMGAELTQNNVNGIISLAAPWAGSMKALKTFISGDTFDIRPIWAGRTNLFQKTFTSLVHLFPSTKVWDNYTEIFSYNSSISKVSFTSWKMKEILEKSLRQYNMLQGRNNFTDSFDEMLKLTPNITKYFYMEAT